LPEGGNKIAILPDEDKTGRGIPLARFKKGALFDVGLLGAVKKYLVLFYFITALYAVHEAEKVGVVFERRLNFL
jgi:hypothetical protein